MNMHTHTHVEKGTNKLKQVLYKCFFRTKVAGGGQKICTYIEMHRTKAVCTCIQLYSPFYKSYIVTFISTRIVTLFFYNTGDFVAHLQQKKNKFLFLKYTITVVVWVGGIVENFTQFP